MTKFLFFITVLAISLPLLGQNKCDSTQMFPNPDELPIFDKDFPDNTNKLFELINRNLRYPITARADNVTGQVLVQFWVDTAGFTIEHRIIESVRQDLDDEVLRIARLIKFEIPAKKDGISVGTCMILPIRFSIHGNGKPSKYIIKQANKTKSLRKSKNK
jgi:TonB family protein